MKANLFYTYNRGKTWNEPRTTTSGYRECVISAAGLVKNRGERTLIAVGPTGIDVAYGGPLEWMSFSEEKGYHVIQNARIGKLIVIAGGNGKVAVIRKKVVNGAERSETIE